ncbi:MAG: hypothetical protein ABUL60_34370, partial [Myxococcales bacterium]
MPDPQRPSGAPLSDSEADRLSERFTASWDDPDPPTLDPPTVPLAASQATQSAPEPGSPVAGAKLVVPAAKPRQKNTLLGIAPIVVGPSQPPPPSPSAPPPPPAPLAAPVAVAAPVAALAPGAAPPVAPAPFVAAAPNVAPPVVAPAPAIPAPAMG